MTQEDPLLSTARPALSNAALAVVLDIWGQEGKQNLMAIAGTSMWPFLQAGDQVYLHHGPDTARWGEVMVFRQQGQLVVHRLVAVRRGSITRFLMLGDNRLYPDPPVVKAEIVGRVTAIRRQDVTIDLTERRWRRRSVLIAVWGFAWLCWLGLRRRLQTRLGTNAARRPLDLVHRLAVRLFLGIRRLLLRFCTA